MLSVAAKYDADEVLSFMVSMNDGEFLTNHVAPYVGASLQIKQKRCKREQKTNPLVSRELTS